MPQEDDLNGQLSRHHCLPAGHLKVRYAWQQPVLSGPHDRGLVLPFAHGDGQAQTRSTTDDVDHDDGVANSCKPLVLSALESVLREQGFDDFVEAQCASFYAETMGRPGLPPGIYFRLLLIGYFEGIDSERGIAWRAADSLALRDFLGVGLDQAPPDHSTISRTRRLIALETHRGCVYLDPAMSQHGPLGAGKARRSASTPRRWKRNGVAKHRATR
jgi:hypothetical protein